MVSQLFILELSKIAEKGKSAVLFPGKSLPNNGRAASPYVDIFPAVGEWMIQKIYPQGLQSLGLFPHTAKVALRGSASMAS